VGRVLQIAGGAMIMPFMLLVIGLLVLGDGPGAPEVPQNSDLARLFGSLLFVLIMLLMGGMLIAIVGMILAPSEHP